MIYLFKGSEKYLISIKIQGVIDKSGVDPFNITTYDCSEVDVEKAIFDACTPAFLGGKKIVIIKNPIFLENDKNHNLKILINYLEKPNEDTILLVNASDLKINEKSEIMKVFTKCANIINTNGISEVEFNAILERTCAKENIKIDKNAQNYFYKTLGNNLISAKNELEKMFAYLNYQGVITENICKELLSKENAFDIYSLTNAIFERNKPKVISIYKEIMHYEKDITSIMNLVSKSMRDTLIVKCLQEEKYDQNEIATYLKTTSNRAYYMIKNASRFSFEEVSDYVSELANLDFLVKSGQVDLKIGFEKFLLNCK